MPDNVKPKVKNLKRNKSRTGETFFLDHIYIGLHEDIDAWPTKEPLSAVETTYLSYGRAAGSIAFVDGAYFAKIEVKKGTLKLRPKNMGQLTDSSAVESEVEFEMDNGPATIGFIEMFKRAEVQLLLPRADEEIIWCGHENSPCEMSEFSGETSGEKSSMVIKFKVHPYSPLYMPTNYAVPLAPIV